MPGVKREQALERSLALGRTLIPGEHLLVACSGGPDSVALAGLLHDIRAKWDLKLTLGHVNHAQRSSAWQDEAVVLRIGAVFDIPVLVAALPAAAQNEASLRKGRYRMLGELASACGATAVATGHTAQDQTETVLLALFRGTGLEGLGGMPERRALLPRLTLVRPLLHVERSSLRRYCHRRMLPYALDPGNADLNVRRNAVRAALEALRVVLPELDRAVARAADIVRREAAGSRRADLRRRVREALREADSLGDVSFGHVEAAVEAIETSRSGRFFMRSGLELQVEGGQFRLRRAK